MGSELVKVKGRELAGQGGGLVLPALIDQAGPRAKKRFVEFFTADIRNPNTRKAYARAVARFLEWCEARGLDLQSIEPLHVAAYIEGLQSGLSKPSVKQHLAALKRLFDWLVTGQVIPMNPASSVRGPKHLVRKGKTPVLMGEEARELLASIDTTTVTGLRDRALIALMVYSFARVGAALAMKVEDYYLERKRGKVRLHEKGGKVITMPTHHNAEWVRPTIDVRGDGCSEARTTLRCRAPRSQYATQLALPAAGSEYTSLLVYFGEVPPPFDVVEVQDLSLPLGDDPHPLVPCLLGPADDGLPRLDAAGVEHRLLAPVEGRLLLGYEGIQLPPSDRTPAGMLHSPPPQAATGKPQRSTFAQN